MKISTLILAVILAVVSTSANANKYKCTNKHGYPSYQEQACLADEPGKVVEIDTVKGRVKVREPGLQKQKDQKAYFVSGKSRVVFTNPDK